MHSLSKTTETKVTASSTPSSYDLLATNWATFPIAESAEKEDVLADYSHYLGREFQLPLESSTLIACSAIIAAAGCPRSLEGPGTIVTPLTLNLVLAGDSSSMPHLAASEAFQTLIVMTRRRFWAHQHYEPGTFEREEQEIKRLIEDARVLDRKAREDRNDWKRRAGEDYEEKWKTHFANSPPDFQRYEEEAASKREGAFATQAQLRLERFPAILLEGASPEEILDVHRITPDGSIFNLDLEGRTWSALVSERMKNAREYAHRFGAGWRRSPYVANGEFFPAATISSLALMQASRFTRIWNSRPIEEGGLRSTLLLASVDTPGTPANSERAVPGSVPANFHNRLIDLIGFRNWTKDETVLLSREARTIFFRFARDIQQAEQNPLPIPREVLQSAPQNALRLALALHLGAREPGDDPVDERTMRKACHLVAWSAFGAKNLFERTDPAALRSSNYDEEAILAMVVRVRRKGRLTKRDLFRSYHDQRSAKLGPVLDKALEMGLLVEKEDGVLSVPDDGDDVSALEE